MGLTTVPNVRWDTRQRYWQKILAKYQSQPGADPRNNLHFAEPLRRVQVKVLKAMSASQGVTYNNTTLRRLETTMVRTVIRQ